MESNVLQHIVAKNLRYWRKVRKFTVGDLANHAGVAKGTLSQLERGLANPTLDTLWALAMALNVPFGTLITPSEEPDFLPQVSEVADPMSHTVLLDRNVGDFGVVEVYHMTLGPQRRRQASAHPNGVFEVVVGLEGSCGVGPDSALQYLLPGDVVTFFADREHSYVSGAGGCHIVVLVFYPELRSDNKPEIPNSESLSWPAAWARASSQLTSEVFSGTLSVTLQKEVWRANARSSTHHTFLSDTTEPAFYRFDIIPMGRMIGNKEETTRKKLARYTEGEGLFIGPKGANEAVLAKKLESGQNWLYCEDVSLSRDLFLRSASILADDGRLIVLTHLIDPYFTFEEYQRNRLLYIYGLELYEWSDERVVPVGHPIRQILQNYIGVWTKKNVAPTTENCSQADDQWIDATTLIRRAGDAGFRMAEHYRVSGIWSLSEWSSGRHAFLFVKN